MLEKDLLAKNDFGGGEDHLPRRIDGAPRDGWGILVGLGREQDQDGETDRHCGDDGAPPPRRERPFCSLRRRAHDEVILAITVHRSLRWSKALPVRT
jgi:hypothetical protein